MYGALKGTWWWKKYGMGGKKTLFKAFAFSQKTCEFGETLPVYGQCFSSGCEQWSGSECFILNLDLSIKKYSQFC